MNNVLVLVEHQSEQLSNSTLATLGAALKLAPQSDVLLVAENDKLASTLANLVGVKNVLVATDSRFTHVLAEDLTEVLLQLAKNYTHILAPASTFGKNVMPRLAALLDVAAITDVSTIESADIFVRPIYAGNAFEKVRAKDSIKILTIRTTAFENVSAQPSAAPIKPLNLSLTFTTQVKFISQHIPESTRPELTAARIVVSGGRALKSLENFKMIENLADKLGAAVGASRAAVDAGFIENEFQVGQTGKVVAPDLYIAIGISGAIQHLAGMKDSKVIVAINKDPEAPIFQVADYGLVGDLFTILPELQEALNK